MCRCSTSGRGCVPWCLTLHETVARVIVKDPMCFRCPNERLLELPRFASSDLLRHHGPDRVALIALYTDGVKYTRTDGFLVLFFNVFAVYRVITWSIKQLVDGRYSATRHDGGLLGPSGRRNLGGSCLPLFGELVEVRADWQEFSTSFAFKPWSSSLTPCFKCNGTLARGSARFIHQYTANVDHAACNRRDDARLREAIMSAQFEVNVDHATAAAIEACLHVDSRKHGAQGRAPRSAVPNTELRAFDRLEVGGAISDTHVNLAELPAYPARIVFFRAAAGNFLNDVCPLFDVVVFDNLLVDILHTLDLGVAQYTGGAAIAFLLLHDMYDTGATSTDLKTKFGLRKFQEKLIDWYTSNRADPNLARINLVTRHVAVGPNIGIHAKGMESR